MITNIANMKEAGVQVQQKFLNSHVLFHKDINRKVYEKIGLKFNNKGRMFFLDQIDPYKDTMRRNASKESMKRSTSKESVGRSSSILKKKRVSPIMKV